MNLCGRFPDSGSLADSQTLPVLRRSNLDIFLSRDTSNICGILGYSKEIVSRVMETGMTVPFPAIAACTLVDELGIGVVI